MDTKNGWDILSHEEAFKTPIFTLKKERAKCLRTDAEGDFYHFECVDWVNIIAITPDDKFIMIKQYRHGSKKVELEIPGGGIDPRDNDPVAAGVRELLEETGYQGEPGKLIGQVIPNPALQGNLCYTVLVKNAVKVQEPDMEATEDIETILMSYNEVIENIRNGTLSHGLVLNAIHFYQMLEK